MIMKKMMIFNFKICTNQRRKNKDYIMKDYQMTKNIWMKIKIQIKKNLMNQAN